VVEDYPKTNWPTRIFACSAYLLAFTAPISIVAAQVFAGSVLIVGHLILWSGARRWRMNLALAILILSYMSILLVSSLLSPDFNSAIPQLRKSWVLFCILPLTVLGWALSDKKLIKALIWGTAIASVIGIGRYVLLGIDRAAPFSGGYTTLAVFNAAILPILMVTIAKGKNHRLLNALVLIIIVAGLFLTQTRAGWLAAIVAALIAGFYLNKRMTLIAVGLTIIIGVAIPQTRWIIQDRLSGERIGGISSGRVILWRYSAQPLSDLPILGHGPGSFRRLAPDSLIAQVGDPGVSSWHSTPLDILIETGPLAISSVAGIIIIPLVFAWRKFKAQPSRLDGLALFASLIALYIAGLTTNLFRDFLILCLLVTLWSLAMRQEELSMDFA
jgi:O-antigen ligase